MSEAAIKHYYRFQCHVYDGTRWTILHGRRKAVERLELEPDSQVMEVGCGTGLNFRYMLEHLDPERGRLVGLDFSKDMLRRAQRRIDAGNWKNVELLEADASTLRLERPFDAVLFAYSIAVIPDWTGALRRAHEHLRPGGRLVVLEFGHFDRWGLLGKVLRSGLRVCHVETSRRYPEAVHDVFGNADVQHWLGGYSFTAQARKQEPAPTTRAAG